MKFFIVDDCESIRTMLSDFIMEEDLGIVKGEAGDGSEVYADLLIEKEIDILLIDLVLPNRNGIETIREIRPSFKGKIIMISEVTSKKSIGEAYLLGIDHYITKPVTRPEVVSVIKNVAERILLERSIESIKQSLTPLNQTKEIINNSRRITRSEDKVASAAKNVLMDLGIMGESGNKDLIDIIVMLYKKENETNEDIPALKDLFETVICIRHGKSIEHEQVRKEIKASEQRIRRAIHLSLEYIASLGLTDFANPKFEHYASTFFDYSQVRIKMLELDGKKIDEISHSRINIKKFITMLYLEARQQM